MDATRTRRTQDPARQRWYASWRALRFARFCNSPFQEARDWKMDPRRPSLCTDEARPPRRVLLVDDSPAFLDSASHFLNTDPRIEIVGRASSGRGALEKVPELKPDLVLMDLTMPEMNGLEATREIKSQPDGPRVIILTLHDIPEYRAAAEAVRADGFVTKTELDLQLLPMIHKLFA
jgi:CheY-like chemotaxis protein